jgi:prepilin-type N-terminal cleavage/methylation domain-containing protein
MHFRLNPIPPILPRARQPAFTLVELLVVMAIILVMTALVVPAFTSIGSAGNFTSAAADIGSTIEQARAYAMANNTYVYVGIGEYLVTESPSTSPRTVGTGQIVLAIVASRDGTSGYDTNNPASTWDSNYQGSQNGASFLTSIDKLHVYNNVHLADFGLTPPASGNMARPALASEQYCLGNALSVSATPFSWPLGKALSAGQYNFTKVIQIDPEGVARIQTPTSADSITSFMEIDLQPTHGSIAPAPPANQNAGNQAAVQIDCMTGAATVYRP